MDLSQVIQLLETISLQTDNSVLRWNLTFSCINNDNRITTEYSVTQNLKKTYLSDEESPEGDSIHDPNLTKQILDKDLDLMVIDRSNYFFAQERFQCDTRAFNRDLEKFLK